MNVHAQNLSMALTLLAGMRGVIQSNYLSIRQEAKHSVLQENVYY